MTIGCREVVWALILSVTLSAQTPTENLQAAWDTALRVDHTVRAARGIRRSAEQGISAARAARLPSVTVQTAYTLLDHAPAAVFELPLAVPGLPPSLTVRQPLADNKFVLSNVSVSLPVFTANRIRDTVDAASAARDALRDDEGRIVLDLKLSVAEAYLGLLRAQRTLQVAQSNVITLRSVAADVQNVYDEGIVAKNDLLAAQVALADARQQEIRVNNSVDVARAAYNRLLGRPLTDPVALEEILPEPPSSDLQAATQQALRTRPEIAAFSSQAQSLSKQASSIRAAQRPQIALTGGDLFVQNDFLVHQSIWSVSVGVRWELFDGGAKRSQASAFEERAESTREQRSDALTAVELQVRQAWLDAQETERRISVTQDALAQAEENLKVSRDRYVEGVGTNTEVLDAEALRVRTLSNYYNATFDAVLARMRLHRAIGDL